jgi:nucleoside-diphosphate-sugar epimerase
VRRFIYASSSSIYGDTSILPVTETVTPHPFSPYGVTKLAAEHLCTLYHRNFGLPTVSLRYFTVYGPRQRPDMAFHRFCKAILEHQPISVYDNGEQKRDFTYIDDIIEANIHAAISPTALGQVLNVAGGSYVTIHQAIQLLKDVSGIPIHVEYASKQKGDIRDIFADISLAEKVLDYYPRVSLKEGLEQEFEDIRSSLHSRSRRFAVSMK